MFTVRPHHARPARVQQGTFGPFVPNTEVEVPLWFAVTLRRRQKCVVAPPPWLALEPLTKVLEEERKHDSFTELPYHYVEVWRALA